MCQWWKQSEYNKQNNCGKKNVSSWPFFFTLIVLIWHNNKLLILWSPKTPYCLIAVLCFFRNWSGYFRKRPRSPNWVISSTELGKLGIFRCLVQNVANNKNSLILEYHVFFVHHDMKIIFISIKCFIPLSLLLFSHAMIKKIFATVSDWNSFNDNLGKTYGIFNWMWGWIRVPL